jgi:hypothetical protein
MPWFKKRSETSDRVATDSSPNGVYSGLRHQALSTNRSEVGIAAPTSDAPVWGTLMETGYDSVTVTLVALSDGSTSLYFSNGGGVIGGQRHEAVRRANAALIDQANRSLPDLNRCETFPIPETAYTVFYVLTDSGILTGAALEDDLGYDRHPLSALFHAGHEVITQLRMISEAIEGDE